MFDIIKINNFQGDLTDDSAEQESLLLNLWFQDAERMEHSDFFILTRVVCP